jgi:L-methionine (R)-S-oxide reductase
MSSMQNMTSNQGIASKTAFYTHLYEQLQELLGNERNFVANAANMSAFLARALPDVNWTGFYITEGSELVLGPFQGAPACARIPFGKGVCGEAAVKQETVIVGDVSQFPGHIACDQASQSEIVVPLLNWGKLLGVLDIDSTSLNRFDEDDQEGLEALVSVFLSSQVTDDLPDLTKEAAASQIG